MLRNRVHDTVDYRDAEYKHEEKSVDTVTPLEKPFMPFVKSVAQSLFAVLFKRVHDQEHKIFCKLTRNYQIAFK